MTIESETRFFGKVVRRRKYNVGDRLSYKFSSGTTEARAHYNDVHIVVSAQNAVQIRRDGGICHQELFDHEVSGLPLPSSTPLITRNLRYVNS